MNLKIVSMNKSHLDRLCRNLDEYDEFWTKSILEDEINNENSKYFVAIDDRNEIVAFGGLWFNIDEAHVMNIAVKKEFRRNHIGTKLLNFLVEEAKKKKKDCITLEVREDNVPAIELYKKLEFTEVGRRRKYYNKLFDAIIMTKFFAIRNYINWCFKYFWRIILCIDKNLKFGHNNCNNLLHKNCL